MAKLLSLAETFHSLQGEGVYTGVPMHFIRLAGCNVGVYNMGKILDVVKNPDFPMIKDHPTRHSICESVGGEQFLCDTDYHRHFQQDVDELITQTYEERICLTGGEPLLQPKAVEWVLEAALANNIRVHIETSGTKLPSNGLAQNLCWSWLVCSPKKGFLPDMADFVDEWKFLVGPNFRPEIVKECIQDSTAPVYIQPINALYEHDPDNLGRCLDLLKEYPRWRLSAQLHKYIGQR